MGILQAGLAKTGLAIALAAMLGWIAQGALADGGRGGSSSSSGHWSGGSGGSSGGGHWSGGSGGSSGGGHWSGGSGGSGGSSGGGHWGGGSGGGGYHGGGRHFYGGGGHFYGGGHVVIRPGFYPRRYYYYVPGPYYSPYYYPPAYYPPPVAYAPPVLPSMNSGYLYFCPASQAYYPQVLECTAGWMQVAPGSPPPN